VFADALVPLAGVMVGVSFHKISDPVRDVAAAGQAGDRRDAASRLRTVD
jgi:hypothetical protein